MKKITHVDPNDFEKTEVEYDDFHYELAERLRYLMEDYAEDDESITGIIPDKEGNHLILGLIKREPGEKGEKFKITIEKINSDEE